MDVDRLVRATEEGTNEPIETAKFIDSQSRALTTTLVLFAPQYGIATKVTEAPGAQGRVLEFRYFVRRKFFFFTKELCGLPISRH